MSPMRQAHSIKARLSLVFLFFFLLVIVLGLESLRSLNYVNDASAQIRVRWLPSTRALGDLNNLTTDFPAAETAMLRASTESERATTEQQMADLDRGIAAAQLAYRQIRHDATEIDLYTRFESRWSEYRSRVARVQSLPPGGAGAAAHDIEVESKSAYDAASDLLGMLTQRNLASAREASERSDLVYAQARKRIILAILFAGLLVAGAMLHVTQSISAPLVDLAARMHRLAASETSVDVLGTRRHDEIGEMARAVVVFRNNAIDLAQNRHTLAMQAALLQEKLDEEQRVTLLQRNFVAMASHEFRTPLAIIDGNTQRLISMRDRMTLDELAERTRKIRSMVRRMTQLIDNLIGSARLVDARMDLYYHPTPVELTSLVRETCQLQRELTPDAQIREQIQAPPLVARGDANLLSQLFSNLLSNAVKYSPDGGLIQITAAQDGTQIAVVIEDQGIGIPEADRERVFERYYRGSNTSGICGTGVGLSLVRMIVDLHKGTVSVESREGEGSRFTIRFPAVTAAAQRIRNGGDGETLIRGSHEHDLVS
ncbi:MAG: ATP-binding protein [Steroidobacteraceae bacterium]